MNKRIWLFLVSIFIILGFVYENGYVANAETNLTEENVIYSDEEEGEYSVIKVYLDEGSICPNSKRTSRVLIKNKHTEDICGINVDISVYIEGEKRQLDCQYKDKKGNIVSENDIMNSIVKPNETLEFYVDYIIPSDYTSNSTLYKGAEVKFVDGKSESDGYSVTGIFLENIVDVNAKPQTVIKAGETVVFDCTITNVFPYEVKLREFFGMCDPIYYFDENGIGHPGGTTEGVLLNVKAVDGTDIPESMNEIALAPGESWECKMEVRISSKWGEDSRLELYVGASQEQYVAHSSRSNCCAVFYYDKYTWEADPDGTTYCYDRGGELIKDRWVLADDGELRYIDDYGAMVTDEFVCDGTYTYYLQYNGSPMKDRLTYHPDNSEVIYFDENGHEVFNDFAHVTTSISGYEVDDYCYFGALGYMYVDVVTYDKEGVNLLYANPYGVLERGRWFQFSDTVMCADGTPWNGAAGNFGCADENGNLVVNTWTYDWLGRLCYLQGNGVALY